MLQARGEVGRDPGGVVTGSGAWGRGGGQGERSRPHVPTLSGLCPQRSRCPHSAPSCPIWGPLHRRQPNQKHSLPSSAQLPQPPRLHCPGLCPVGRMRLRVTAGTASPKTTCATGKRTAPTAVMKRTAVRAGQGRGAGVRVLGVGERPVGGGPPAPQGGVPGGASRVGEQFQKGTPGFLYFFLQCLLRQKYSVFSSF